jgi:hypothetical protein
VVVGWEECVFWARRIYRRLAHWKDIFLFGMSVGGVASGAGEYEWWRRECGVRVCEH